MRGGQNSMVWTDADLLELAQMGSSWSEAKASAKERWPEANESTLRRRYAEVQRYLLILKGSPLTPAEENIKDREIARLRADKTHLTKLYKSQTKETAGIAAMVDAINELVPIMKPVAVPKPPVIKGTVEVESLVLCLGDLHFGEVVDPEQTGNFSRFNMQIAEARFNHTIDTCIKLAREKMVNYRFPKLHVFGLGDFVSGIIHDELRVNDELGIVAQCLEAERIVRAGLLKLCQVFEQVEFTGVVGNHGRVTEHYYFKGKANNNYDYLIYKVLERTLSNQPNLKFNVPQSFFTIADVEGTRFLLTHGDVVKSWMGMPFYGLSRAYMKWRVLHADYGYDFQHMVIGHFHNPNIFTIIRNKLIINGCLKGGDEYSIGAIAAACDPVQYMFGVHPTRGITFSWEINSKDA